MNTEKNRRASINASKPAAYLTNQPSPPNK